MCDVAGRDGSSREIVAFVGGLDVTMGRYDTSQHPVMPGANPAFAEDYRSVLCLLFKGSAYCSSYPNKIVLSTVLAIPTRLCYLLF
jgi:hypothetical protein